MSDKQPTPTRHGVSTVDPFTIVCLCDDLFFVDRGGWIDFNAHLDASLTAERDEARDTIAALEEALAGLRGAAGRPYHRNPAGGPDGYPPEGHREYSCPLCLAFSAADRLLADLHTASAQWRETVQAEARNEAAVWRERTAALWSWLSPTTQEGLADTFDQAVADWLEAHDAEVARQAVEAMLSEEYARLADGWVRISRPDSMQDYVYTLGLRPHDLAVAIAGGGTPTADELRQADSILAFLSKQSDAALLPKSDTQEGK